MGDPGFTVPYERLVALSPYFIGTQEVTTGEARASGLAVVDAAAGKADPYLYSSDASTVRHYCTFTQNPDTREDVPVNCVTRDFARRYCAKAGASLVTTAQYEFVAGARRDAAFPWGEATAACADAVFGRTYDATAPAPFRACKALGVGVAKPGTGRLDRVRMPDGKEVVDLAGNVAEWSLDDYQRINEPCNRENPATDPVCREPSPSSPGLLSVRGAAWTSAGGSLLRAAVVSSIPAADQQNTRIGFRCARPGR
jgi:formylglycine-generating enzyme required for sulfatase activity